MVGRRSTRWWGYALSHKGKAKDPDNRCGTQRTGRMRTPMQKSNPNSSSTALRFAGAIRKKTRFQEMEMMQAQPAAQDAAHQQNLAVVAGHYQRQIADLAGFVKSKFPDEQELPPSLFAAPPLPVPAHVHASVSILTFALTCAAIMQVLITSLVLCAGSVGRFEPDSRCYPSTGSFSTTPDLPDLPHTAVHVGSTTIAGLLLVAGGADAAGASPALLSLRLAAGVRVDSATSTVTTIARVVCVGARWGRWDPGDDTTS
jgi:hypothetical protein